jgi:hypothetical protein
VQADLRPPTVTISNVVPLISQGTTATALHGSVSDGSGIASLDLHVTAPDSSFAIVPATRTGNSWSYADTFDQAGVYNVGIRAVDTFGNERVRGTFDLHVAPASVNVPPTVGLAPGYVVAEGGTVVLDSNASDLNGDVLTYGWDLDDDGAFDDGSTATVVFSAADRDGPSSQQVRVQVTDGRSDPIIATTIVSIVNAAPDTIALSLDAAAINENGTVSLQGTFRDTSALDTHTIVIDWGDSGSNSTTVTVSNVAPTLQNVAAINVNENSATTLTGRISDPGTKDTFTLALDWGDGSALEEFSYPAGTTMFTETHRYLDDEPSGTPSDTYTIALTVFDDDTGSRMPARH